MRGTWVCISGLLDRRRSDRLTSSPPSPFLPLLPTSKAVLMATGSSSFNHELAGPTVTADGRLLERYFVDASSSHGGARFQNSGGAPAGVPDLGSLVAGIGIGMASASFVVLEGALAAAGYSAAGVVPTGVAVARQPRIGGHGEAVPFKGAWTMEEDEILKEMVRFHGDRKWAAIAENLRGRIGKQCRERWTNHLRPDIKKVVWTEGDDRALIEAHKCYGNSWSAIARCLPGRSENAVKNHWNATKRSLKSTRRLKKKKSQQAAPGQFSLLEEYIRRQCLTTEPTVPSPVSALSSNNFSYGVLASPNITSQPDGSNPLGMEMYLSVANSIGSSHLGAMNLNMPPDLNAYDEPQEGYCALSFAPENLRYGLHVAASAQQQMINAQDLQAAYMNRSLYPFAENLTSIVDLECQSSNRDNVGGYYNDAVLSSAGGSGDPDDIDIVHMASGVFLTPSEDEVTLDLTRFK